MCDIILKKQLPIKNLSGLEDAGKKIYSENKNLRTLVNLLEHPEFASFVHNNTQDWTDVKTIVLYIKIYQMIEKRFPNISPYKKLAILKKIIDSPSIWRTVIKEYNRYIQK